MTRGAAAPDLRRIVEEALREDIGRGDWTTLWTVPSGRTASASIIAKADGVIAGLATVVAVFEVLGGGVRLELLRPDGADVRAGDSIARLGGPARDILTGERVALNFLQRLSGVATLTRKYVDAVAGTPATILDTRKTTPGLRALERNAVVVGGGANHRFGLFDMVLIKENHIRAAGGIGAAVGTVRSQNAAGLAVEVETTTLAEVDEALEAGVDRILLDNMSVEMLRDAVAAVRSSGAATQTEASGGVSLSTVRAIAATGVDFISVGALTHSAPALDLSLLIDESTVTP